MQNNRNMEWLNKWIILYCMINIYLNAPQQCFWNTLEFNTKKNTALIFYFVS